MPCVPKLKLTYFDGAGRAEATRLALHIGGVPFVDNRVNHEQFAKLKPTYVYGQLPVLEVDGVELAQSQAMLRYAGKLAGLYPANDALAALQIDEIVCSLDDMLNKIIPSMRETDEDKKKAMRAELASTTLPHCLEMIEARLAGMKKSNVVFQDPSALFIHDLAIYGQVMQLQSGRIDHIPKDICAPYTEFMAAANKVLAHPKVQQWNAMHVNSMAKPLDIKLTYFDNIGRGEPIRMALVLGNLPFEDIRIDHATLGENRDKYPFGQLPALEVNGQLFAQSLSILRYVGTLGGLYPVDDAVAAFRVDEMISLYDDFFAAVVPIVHRSLPDETTRAAKMQELLEVTLPKLFGLVDKRIAFWNGKFAVGDSLTIADTIVYGLVANIKSYAARNLFTLPIEGFENVVRVAKQVEDMESVKAWYAKKQ